MLRLHVGNLQLTQFQPADTRDLYAIRNHLSVRRFMAKPDLIPFASHRQWVAKDLLANPALLLLMVRPAPASRAIGFTQLRIASGVGEIGVMFRQPEQHRLTAAIATALTIHVGFTLLHLDFISSYVIPEHQHAIAFNRAWGGKDVPSDRPGLIKLQMSREEGLANDAYQRVFSRLQNRLHIDQSPDPS